MSDIKIFVSHRIDQKSVRVDNSLFNNVRCGAVFDKKSSDIPGDNTGDNISEKRMTFCELTVQYWAWKNVNADYYGLCHYRRYLSFSEKCFKTNEQNVVVEPILSLRAIRRHKLTCNTKMQSLIEEYDAVVSESADVKHIPTPKGKFPNTVQELWEGHDQVFIYKKDLTVLMQAIKILHPEYLIAAQDYLNGSAHRGYNCFILRHDLFFQMCQFQFDVLLYLEQHIDISSYKGNLRRTFGYMGELMYGMFIHYIELQGTYKIKTLQLVYFEETQKPRNRLQGFWLAILAYMTIFFRHSSEIVLPKGSLRRERVKEFKKRLRGKK